MIQSAFKIVSVILISGIACALEADTTAAPQKLTLEACIQMALEKHQALQVSAANVAMAEAMYRQAMSAYWPSIKAEVDAQRSDQDRTFSVQGQFELPNDVAQLLQLGLAKPVGTIPLNMNVKLFDRDVIASSLNLTYPLFTGLKREALVAQTEKAIQIAEQGQRKTNLEVVRDVKKYFYAAQFAQQMEQLTSDTLERFQALEDLTERLFQNGSLKVKKTDYLRSKTTTALTRTVLSEARYALEMAHEALGNAMGQAWDEHFVLAEPSETTPLNESLQALVETAQSFNPELQQLRLAVQISDDQITEAQSGYYPMIGFHASAYNVQNDYKSGLTNKANRDGWTIGIGMQWQLFDGFLTAGKVDQAKAQQRKLESQQVLLDQAIALQVKQQFLSIKTANTQTKDSQNAANFASENRKLHMRAYQDELVETKDVIEAQVVETFAQGAHFRSQYALEMGLLSLEYLIGQHVQPL